MLIPTYWAESRGSYQNLKKRTVIVTRFGWSMTSVADAQAMANERLKAAIQEFQAASGDVRSSIRIRSIIRRESRSAYNGADGMPIREEIVQRIDPDVITRNSYGALCLNTPDVLFVDIDFSPAWNRPIPWSMVRWTLFEWALMMGLGWVMVPSDWNEAHPVIHVLFYIGLAGTLLPDTIAQFRHLLPRTSNIASSPDDESHIVRSRLRSLSRRYPEGHYRLYRTPAGFRVLAMHQTYDPAGEAAADHFRMLGADETYVRMCVNQQCFRARLTPKPWRIGMPGPRRLRWPVTPALEAQRAEWIQQYTEQARTHAACTYLEYFGSGTSLPRTEAVLLLHDESAGATTGRPIA